MEIDWVIKKIMRKLICVFTALIFISCANSSNKIMTDNNLPNDIFPLIKKIEIDSVKFESIIKDNPYLRFIDFDLKLPANSLSKELCGANKKYNIFNVGKIEESTNQYFIFFFVLNQKCQYDGFEHLFVLYSFDSKGNFLKEEIIGKKYMVFGESENFYFKIYNQKIFITKSSYFEDEFGEIKSDHSKDIINLN
jgi:hypothetical protein